MSRKRLLKSLRWPEPSQKNPQAHPDAERGAVGAAQRGTVPLPPVRVRSQKVVDTGDLAVSLILNQSVGYLLFHEPFLPSKQMAPRWLAVPGLGLTSESVLSRCQRPHLPPAAVLAPAALCAGNPLASPSSGIQNFYIFVFFGEGGCDSGHLPRALKRKGHYV